MTPAYLRRWLRAVLMVGFAGGGFVAAAVLVGVVVTGISVVIGGGYMSDFVGIAGELVMVGLIVAAVIIGVTIIGAVVAIIGGVIVELAENDGNLARARARLSRMAQSRTKTRRSGRTARGTRRCRVRYGWRILVLATLMAPAARQRWLEAIVEALHDFEPAHRPALLRDFRRSAVVVIVRSWTVDFVRSGASR
jgi:MFS family permease